MLYMQSQGYDQAFFTAWHHNGLNSIAGLNATLAAVGSSDSFDSLLKDLAVSVLADAYIDAGAGVTGASVADLQISDADATIFFNAKGTRTPRRARLRTDRTTSSLAQRPG